MKTQKLIKNAKMILTPKNWWKSENGSKLKMDQNSKIGPKIQTMDWNIENWIKTQNWTKIAKSNLKPEKWIKI